MCGFLTIVGAKCNVDQLDMLVSVQQHRGPDDNGVYVDPSGAATLIHNRLSIIDLSERGRQPMSSDDGRFHVVFNGEIYNYQELRQRLGNYKFRSATDTEVLLAAYQQWGERALDELIGMFSFAIWDQQDQSLFAVRDRFGVKPFYYHHGEDGRLFAATEIKALHACGVPAEPDEQTWATFLMHGLMDYSDKTFWQHVSSLPPGHSLRWRDGKTIIACWYDLADRVGVTFDERDQGEIEEEYEVLLRDAVALRFRSDVPVGVNVSGGLDSSALLATILHNQSEQHLVKAYTFVTGDSRYDELPWVRSLLKDTGIQLEVCLLAARDVPDLASSIQMHQDEPYGGLPTIAYANLFDQARADGVVVLLDGQGMDEQWAGYDYYASALDANCRDTDRVVQGTTDSPTRPDCLCTDFANLARRLECPSHFPDRLRNMQYRDARFTKIPRALRFNDRVSMRSSTELREPFLDHRLFELAMRQPPRRKIQGGVQKWTLRRIVKKLAPNQIAEAPKRPLQTPQREWLRDSLREWGHDMIEVALNRFGGNWLDTTFTRRHWNAYCEGASDNSFYVWQWITLGICCESLFDVRRNAVTFRDLN